MPLQSARVDGNRAGWRDPFWIVLILLAPLLLFPNLGNRFLWQDEAETALLARSVVQHGYPLAHDGQRTISDQPGSPDVNDAGVWIWTPWLQLYPVAASFALLGESARDGQAALRPGGLGQCAARLRTVPLHRPAAHGSHRRTAAPLLGALSPAAAAVPVLRLPGVLHSPALLGLPASRAGAEGRRPRLRPRCARPLPHAAPSAGRLHTRARPGRPRRAHGTASLVLRVVGWSLLVAALCLPFFLYTQGLVAGLPGPGVRLRVAGAIRVDAPRGSSRSASLRLALRLRRCSRPACRAGRRRRAFAGLALCSLWLLSVAWAPSCDLLPGAA